ncbi:MAG: hypothetical protein ACK2T3_07955 [Candidatus Promineifilaceae bacterium]|jgi:hypothetical protein
MSESEGTAVLVALFALRCVLPLAITLAFGYLMNRLVDRWQAEDASREQESPETDEMIPVLPKGMRLPTIDIPCWVFNNCEESIVKDCVAYANPSIPCYVARMQADGKLPKRCANCEIYATAVVPVT